MNAVDCDTLRWICGADAASMPRVARIEARQMPSPTTARAIVLLARVGYGRGISFSLLLVMA
jgi:hypothetical protein